MSWNDKDGLWVFENCGPWEFKEHGDRCGIFHDKHGWTKMRRLDYDEGWSFPGHLSDWEATSHLDRLAMEKLRKTYGWVAYEWSQDDDWQLDCERECRVEHDIFRGPTLAHALIQAMKATEGESK